MPTFYGDQAKGSSAQLVYAEETDYGTTFDSAAYLMPLTTEGLQNNINLFESERIVTNRSVPAVLEGNVRPEGDIAAEVFAGSVYGTLVKHALGEVDVVSGYGSANTPAFGTGGSSGGLNTVHYLVGGDDLKPLLRSATYIGGGSAPPANQLAQGLTIEKQFTDVGFYILYRGARIDTWTVNWPTEGLVTSTFRIVAASEADIATSSVGSPFDAPTSESAGTLSRNVDPFTSFETKYYLGTGGQSGTLSANEIAWIRSANMTVANNLFADNFVQGQRERANCLPGRRRINGNLTMLFRRREDYLALQNSSAYPKYLRIEMTKRTSTGDDDAWVQMTIDIPYIKFGGGPGTPAISGEGPLEVSVPWQSYRPDSTEEEIKVTIRNFNVTI